MHGPLGCMVGANVDAGCMSHMWVGVPPGHLSVGGRLPGIIYSISSVSLEDTVRLVTLLYVHNLKIILEMFLSLLCLRLESHNFFVFCRPEDTGLSPLVFIRDSRELNFGHCPVNYNSMNYMYWLTLNF